MDTDNVVLTPNEALSGIFGSISLASWVFLLVGMLLKNDFAYTLT